MPKRSPEEETTLPVTAEVGSEGGSQADAARAEKRQQKDTGAYSATKAPENRPHVESKTVSSDPKATPGGAHGADAAVGMEALDRELVPNEARDSGLTDYGSEPAKERRGSGKE